MTAGTVVRCGVASSNFVLRCDVIRCRRGCIAAVAQRRVPGGHEHGGWHARKTLMVQQERGDLPPCALTVVT